MKFRTEIEVSPLKKQIDYASKIFAIGSCFATNIAERLHRRKFTTTTSPLGTAFNPASIASALQRYWQNEPIRSDEFIEREGAWTTYHAHSHHSYSTLDEATRAICDAIECGHNALCKSDFVMITFGTAWVYRLMASGEVVANCHKQPQNLFERELLSVDEIVAMYEPLFETALCDKEVIFSVSPIRHLGDGLEDNSLSKATLRVAIAEICRRHSNAHYFAAYELLMDDLRDYRFYADDMVHPSQQAIEYIWQKFFAAAITESAQQSCQRIERIIKAAEHRPFNAAGSHFKQFCQQMLDSIKEFPALDFSQEVQHFRQYIDKN